MKSNRLKLFVGIGLALVLTLTLAIGCAKPAPAPVVPTPAPAPVPTPVVPTPAPAPAPAPAPVVVEWKYVTNDVVGTDNHKVMEEFANNITKATNGRVKVTAYGMDELPYKAPDTIKVLDQGLIQMAHSQSCFAAGDIPIAVLTDLPFLARTLEQQETYDEVIAEDIKAAYESKFNVSPIGFTAYGRRQIVTKPPVRTVADLRGLKLRASGGMEPLIIKGVLDAVPVTVAFAEVYTALSRGIVDGVLTGTAAHEQVKTYEPGDYFLRIDAHVASTVELVNKDAWDSLPQDVQETILRVTKEFEKTWKQYVFIEWENTAVGHMLEYPDGLKEANAISDQEWLDLQKKSLPIVRDYVSERMGPKGLTLLEKIYKALNVEE